MTCPGCYTDWKGVPWCDNCDQWPCTCSDEPVCECGHVADEHQVKISTGQPDECTVCPTIPGNVCGGYDPVTP